MSPEADTNVARSRQRLACVNAHELQVYGWMRWKLSEHPIVPTTTRATALECVLPESNPNPRAAFCVSCLMHCCQRPTFSVQRLSKTNRLASANISTRSCLMRLPAATAEPPSMAILAGGWPAPHPLGSPLLRFTSMTSKASEAGVCCSHEDVHRFWTPCCLRSCISQDEPRCLGETL